MGYNLIIGELTAEAQEEYVRLWADGVRHDEAPAFGEHTDHTNSRDPSYSTWAEFCRSCGIEELFYGSGWSREDRRYKECSEDFHRERPLLSEHPGAAPIYEADAAFVEKALASHKEKNPDAKPGFSDGWTGPIPGKEGLDPTLARLEWLAYWMRWAVDNCKQPVLANS